MVCIFYYLRHLCWRYLHLEFDDLGDSLEFAVVCYCEDDIFFVSGIGFSLIQLTENHEKTARNLAERACN